MKFSAMSTFLTSIVLFRHEAEALMWAPFDALDTFDLDVDQIALGEYRRRYHVQM